MESVQIFDQFENQRELTDCLEKDAFASIFRKLNRKYRLWNLSSQRRSVIALERPLSHCWLREKIYRILYLSPFCNFSKLYHTNNGKIVNE